MINSHVFNVEDLLPHQGTLESPILPTSVPVSLFSTPATKGCDDFVLMMKLWLPLMAAS